MVDERGQNLREDFIFVDLERYEREEDKRQRQSDAQDNCACDEGASDWSKI